MPGRPGPKKSPISDAIRDEVMRYPEAFTILCERAGVSRGGSLRKWLKGEAELMPTTLTKFADVLDCEIILRRRGR